MIIVEKVYKNIDKTKVFLKTNSELPKVPRKRVSQEVLKYLILFLKAKSKLIFEKSTFRKTSIVI